MREKDSAEIVEWYDKLAGGYDELYAEEQSSKYEAALNAIAGQRFETVVDVACGTGLFLEKLLAFSDYAVGVDVSREMVEKARRRQGTGSIDLVRADCSTLPIRDGTADCVFAISFLKNGQQMTGQLREITRITRRDGAVVGTVFRDGGEKRLPDETGLDGRVSFWDLSRREFLFKAHRAML